MNRKLLIVAGFVLAHAYAAVAAAQPQESQPAPAQAQANAPAPAEAAALASAKAESQEADELNKIVCKRMPLTGSRMGRKLCHTQGEWMAMEGGADEFMRDIRSGMTPLNSSGAAAAGGAQIDSAFSNPGGAKAGATPPR